ncbi:hypothetical protein OsJ_09605 [Oryza sativa Japonica Group]|uniref:Uncharacterized protein n=2 Tax=Oryza sativa subsp. japonica TaxID=39947 RepID=A0A8J8Y495_ORYSJ|nr:hypothetical protein LOC_Os03g07740 [Oryza sativa Japonica Group]EAZ25765.1 hypothetical protein OsJ_09605 [Oryza sativa Japonica Group]
MAVEAGRTMEATLGKEVTAATDHVAARVHRQISLATDAATERGAAAVDDGGEGRSRGARRWRRQRRVGATAVAFDSGRTKRRQKWRCSATAEAETLSGARGGAQIRVPRPHGRRIRTPAAGGVRQRRKQRRSATPAAEAEMAARLADSSGGGRDGDDARGRL